MPLTASLSEYVFLLICAELEVPDILSLRQVCRGFCEVTRAKQLWLTLLDTLASDGHVLPPYLGKPQTLDSIALEALVRRVAHLDRKWTRNDLHPADIWRHNLCQSITWLRLVNGSWLFVASSDNYVSKISCWDLSLVFQGSTEPIVEAYLPGKVKTAQVQVQDIGVVLALGLGPNSPSVYVITLCQDSGSHSFAKLGHFEGSSHVLMLQGKFVGCAVRDDLVIPHLIDWAANTIYDLPPPAGSDNPETRCAPHLLISWNDFIVVVRYNCLDLYSQPSPTSDPRLIKSVSTQTIWEVAVLEDPASPSLKLLVISRRGLETYTLEGAAIFDAHAVCTPKLLAASPDERSVTPPWYHLRVSGTGRRALWLAVGDPTAPLVQYPCVCSMSIASSPSGPVNTPILQWTNDLPGEPALWAFPCLDFDEALGITVLGNCFGELAVYDCVGHGPVKSCKLAPDLTSRSMRLPPLSLDPIPLHLHLTPSPPFGHLRPDHTLVSHWSQDALGLELPWRTDWFSMYWRWKLWQGNPGDIAWVIENAYGFPTSIVPQAYGHPSYSDDVDVLFRSGHRYLVYAINEVDCLRGFPLPLPPQTVFRPGSRYGQIQPPIRPTAYTVCDVHKFMFRDEFHYNEGRNRWRELSERGGRPHKNLLDTASVKPRGRIYHRDYSSGLIP
ncbi:hypothetical protein C8R47DRAFT_1119741 [Mycena vitilis]|nr:hypothetical protein C8R47DRAFT_1119741 [Mycena vitilis]